MQSKDNSRREEEKIRRIAYDIYLHRKESGLSDDSDKNWKEAECVVNNKLKYCWWFIWYLLRKYHSSIVAFIAIVSLAANIIMMTWSIIINSISTVLDTRPYVSINMLEPKIFADKEDVFYGGNIILKNNGKIPASDISTQYYITTDMDKENMQGVEWFDKNLGGFGSVAFIAPGDTAVDPGLRSLSPSATYYYFEAITSYKGLEPNKKYWIHIKKVFYIDEKVGNLYAVFAYGSWDKNQNILPPQISKKEDVVKLLEELKKKIKQTN